MDAGRGVAALLVLEHHTMVYFGDRTKEAFSASTQQVLEFLSMQNARAVQFFFFLSGWAIYLALDQARSADGRIDWRVFAWHRCRRILPLYWLAILLSLVLFVPARAPENAADLVNLVGNLFFCKRCSEYQRLVRPICRKRSALEPCLRSLVLCSDAYPLPLHLFTRALKFAGTTAFPSHFFDRFGCCACNHTTIFSSPTHLRGDMAAVGLGFRIRSDPG